MIDSESQTGSVRSMCLQGQAVSRLGFEAVHALGWRTAKTVALVITTAGALEDETAWVWLQEAMLVTRGSQVVVVRVTWSRPSQRFAGLQCRASERGAESPVNLGLQS